MRKGTWWHWVASWIAFAGSFANSACSDSSSHSWVHPWDSSGGAPIWHADEPGGVSGHYGVGGSAARGGGFADGVEPGANAGSAGSACDVGRTSLDRPDDVSGYQVRVNYVLPSDGIDEELDLNGALERSISVTREWMFQQTHGRVFRFDTCEGKLDIRFLRLDRSDSDMRNEGAFLHDALERAMKEAGLLSPTKLEAVFYGGDAAAHCGSAAWPPDLPGRLAAMYLKGTFHSATTPDCDTTRPGESETTPNYTDFGMLHEIFHTLGAAPECAPHHTRAGHTSDSPSDLMYSGEAYWTPRVLDFGRDDYFDHGRPGCLDIASSAFIEPLPSEPKLPQGW